MSEFVLETKVTIGLINHSIVIEIPKNILEEILQNNPSAIRYWGKDNQNMMIDNEYFDIEITGKGDKY